jgi:PBP1b-binding outer membrane lipoprotein LpoB
MKKVFGLLFVAGLFTFASCSNATETASEVETVEETTVEEAPVEEEVIDSVAAPVDSAATPIDSASSL